jgi:hypothetical protein
VLYRGQSLHSSTSLFFVRGGGDIADFLFPLHKMHKSNEKSVSKRRGGKGSSPSQRS